MMYHNGSNTNGISTYGATPPTPTYSCKHFSVSGVSAARCPTCGQLEPQVLTS